MTCAYDDHRPCYFNCVAFKEIPWRDKTGKEYTKIICKRGDFEIALQPKEVE